MSETHRSKEFAQAAWSNEVALNSLHRNPEGRPLFLLHDGPPYANGNLHLGHFVNKSLKDALLKYKRLEGYFAPFVPGFDCHGLPVEHKQDCAGGVTTQSVKGTTRCKLEEKEFFNAMRAG